MKTQNGKAGTVSVLAAISLGIGGIVAGDFFATFGIVAEGARGGAFLSLMIGALVALLTAYSYVRLSLRYPKDTGTSVFILEAFGNGILSASTGLVLVFSYAAMIALYSLALASYACALSPALSGRWELPAASVVIVILAMISVLGPSLVKKLEGGLNVGKLALLLLFTAAAFLMGDMDWDRFRPGEWPTFGEVVSTGMIVFSSYQGFELIIGFSDRMPNRKRDLPLSLYGCILIAMAIYVFTIIAGIGHISLEEVGENRSFALAVAARNLLGPVGFLMIAVAAILASASGINADIFGASRLPTNLAHNQQLAGIFEKTREGAPLYSILLLVVLALIVVNAFNLHAIASMASAGFLLVYMVVNLSNFRLRRQTGGSSWISALAAFACLAAFVIMMAQLFGSPKNRLSAYAVLGVLLLSVLIQSARALARERRARRP